MKIGIKEVGKPVQFIEVNDKYRFDCASRLINDKYHIKPQFVYLTPECELCLAVDEDGLLRDLPINFLMPINNPFWPIQKMVGTVVFIHTKPVTEPGEIWDYEVGELTEEDCEIINGLLDEKLQKKLNEQFEDYGRHNMVFVPIEKP